MSLFRDRRDAGRALAAELSDIDLGDEPVVLGLARGGMPVADEVARRLEVPVDVFVVRKLGVPFQPELAFGAIATGEVRILNDDIVAATGLDDRTIEQVTAEQTRELERREAYYRPEQTAADLEGRVAVLVDDGIATGATMFAAVEAVRRHHPARLVAAVPVAPPKTVDRLVDRVDELICLQTPDPFGGVGAWYEYFDQTTDEQVRTILEDARRAAEST